ncbi:MAG: nuclear transport factor 2 family protein [Halioglobus sp.]|nr:nuclear transport factor 2 family protein [Halioglobus sp.]
MSKGSVEDRLAIRELIERFSAAVIRIDADRFASTFAQDGVWILPSVPDGTRGRDNIRAVFGEKLAYVEHIHMVGFPDELVFDGDRATGATYCRELIFTKDGEQKLLIGCFHDEYVKVDGEWLFQSRDYEVVGLH